eukprot:IDg815t1
MHQLVQRAVREQVLIPLLAPASPTSNTSQALPKSGNLKSRGNARAALPHAKQMFRLAYSKLHRNGNAICDSTIGPYPLLILEHGKPCENVYPPRETL